MIRVTIIALLSLFVSTAIQAQQKAVFIILDGIPADVMEKIETPYLREIAKAGGYTRAYQGGGKGIYSESPTISAVGYNHVLTGTWTNKHNVWDNDIKDPNYHYWNVFRIAKSVKPSVTTGIFSSWTDNRTKLIGEGLPAAGDFHFDYVADGYELDTTHFPHTKDRIFMSHIDEKVTEEASKILLDKGPDLSWVYLEFTDDMGHMYGDSEKFYEAVRKADEHVGAIWKSVKEREKKYHEQWLIVVTTDHGRDAKTGRGHGGQSDRERATWITTNYKPLNAHFQTTPAAVDIMPSILRFMKIDMPQDVKEEVDGVPFIGALSITDLKATHTQNTIELAWNVANAKGTAEIYLTTNNLYKDGGKDSYTKVGTTKTAAGKFTIDVSKYPSGFYKILVKAPDNWVNVWVKE